MFSTARSFRGMVTSPHYLASQAGLGVLQDGGTALEAGVAVAATLAVVYPHMTGIGGDGFWLVAEPSGDIFSIDACGAAALGADFSLYQRAGMKTVPWRGPLAANTVAGTVSGWARALDKSDSNLPLERLFRDAIHFARDGVAVTAGGAAIAAGKDAELRDCPGYADIFRPKGAVLEEGARLRQPALAQTLERLAAEGLQDFYTGGLAKDIAADLEAAGSPLRQSDLSAHTARFGTALTARVKDVQLFNMGPPTQGFASLLILAVADRLQIATEDDFSFVHTLVEATKQAFLLYKNIGLGDPDYMTVDPQGILDNEDKLYGLAKEVKSKKAMAWPHAGQAGDTTWFGVVDQDGRAVSAIQSTYFEFGSGVVLPKTGIVWQNRGASFELAQEGWNVLKPGRKPFHTLNPALAKFDDGRMMAYGTMGGEGQPQTQAAIFHRYARQGLSLQETVTAPRWLLGRTWGTQSVTLKLEDRFDPALFAALRTAGHDVEIVEPFSSTMGHAGALVRYRSGLIEGATDPRSDGMVASW